MRRTTSSRRVSPRLHLQPVLISSITQEEPEADAAHAFSQLSPEQQQQMAQLAARLGVSGFARPQGAAAAGVCWRLAATHSPPSFAPPLTPPPAASRAAPAVSEWTGLKSFPAATQASLSALLSSLRERLPGGELTVLLLGKGGAGKSSTVNSMLGERAAPVAAFTAGDAPRPLVLARSAAGFTLRLIDTPSLVSGGCVCEEALASVVEAVKGVPVHCVLYVDRLDVWRTDSLDAACFAAVSDALGPAVWRRAALCLTHGQLNPPDGAAHADFSQRRAEALRAALRATLPKGEAPELPLAMVENSARCSSNESGEKVLPGGAVVLTQLFSTVSQLATAEGAPWAFDAAAAPGRDANAKWRWAVLPLLAVQMLLLRPLLVRQMRRDGDPGAKEMGRR